MTALHQLASECPIRSQRLAQTFTPLPSHQRTLIRLPPIGENKAVPRGDILLQDALGPGIEAVKAQPHIHQSTPVPPGRLSAL